MAAIEPYTISVPGTKLDNLKKKLEAADFPDELELGDGKWDLGAPLADVKRLVAYWKDGYDWRKHEAKINELSNFKTTIQAEGFEPLDIHFVHQKSEVAGAIPLLFSHGWPGNFLEVEKILPLLVQGGKDHPAFHVVAPSLPNYGFSSGTKRRGFALKQYAETFHKLMQSLGYTEYVVQGGDWGCMISRTITRVYPTHAKACHVNMVRGHAPKFTSNPILYLQHALTPYTKRELEGRQRSSWFLVEGAGYRTQQNTKPQTLGYALADSPVGLLAWMYEKMYDWTDGYPWTEDEILTWVSIYWFSTAGPAASLRIYYESIHDDKFSRAKTEVWVPNVKLGLSYFPKEITVVPLSWGRTMGPVVFEAVHEKGGHFAAHEQPDVLVADLRAMFGKKGGAYGVIKGKDGYQSGPKL